jgi:lysozyme
MNDAVPADEVMAVAARLVAEFEGFSAKPYLCPANVWTIGYGTTRINGQPVTAATPPVTRAQAQALLRNDLAQFARDVDRLCRMRLTNNQRAALISFAYNLGAGALQRSTLLRFLKNENYADAADQFDVWVFAGGQRLNGLVRRRAAEKALFLTPDGPADPIPAPVVAPAAHPAPVARQMPAQATTDDQGQGQG